MPAQRCASNNASLALAEQSFPSMLHCKCNVVNFPRILEGCFLHTVLSPYSSQNSTFLDLLANVGVALPKLGFWRSDVTI